MKEAELQSSVENLARWLGWRVAHFRPAQTKAGRWLTAVSADGKGFPDCVLVHPKYGVLVRELKCGKNRLSAEQKAWLEDLSLFVDAGVWTDADWVEGRILAVLKGDF